MYNKEKTSTTNAFLKEYNVKSQKCSPLLSQHSIVTLYSLNMSVFEGIIVCFLNDFLVLPLSLVSSIDDLKKLYKNHVFFKMSYSILFDILCHIIWMIRIREFDDKISSVAIALVAVVLVSIIFSVKKLIDQGTHLLWVNFP